MKNNCEKIFSNEIITVILQRDFWQKSINSLKKEMAKVRPPFAHERESPFFCQNRVERNFALFF